LRWFGSAIALPHLHQKTRAIAFPDIVKEKRAIVPPLSTDKTRSSDRLLWIVVLLLPNARHCIIAGFHNRQDADDRLRFLQKAVSAVKFEIIFNLLEQQV
jgi:hypothetical protein